MKFSLITLFPDITEALQFGVIGRALEQQLIMLNTVNPRDFAAGPHHNVDDRPYGGGPGMVMLYQPLVDAIQYTKKSSTAQPKVIYLSPQGQPLTQTKVNALSEQNELILLAGRYEGIDQRVIDQHVDEELSVGDYVVSGGELPAMLLIDAITRMIPGTLGDDSSNQQDSFQPFLDHDHYTRPPEIDGLEVPATLMSGDHGAIKQWRLHSALRNTWQKRKDLLKRRILSSAEQDIIRQVQEELNSPPVTD